jgi:hypothetical protein
MEQEEVVERGIENIAVEVNRDLRRSRGTQPLQNALGRTRQILRAEPGDPMLPDEVGLDRRGLGQGDICCGPPADEPSRPLALAQTGSTSWLLIMLTARRCQPTPPPQ